MSTKDTPHEVFMGTLRSAGPPTNLPAVVSDCRNALSVHQAHPSPSNIAALHAEASRVIDAAYSAPAVASAPAPAPQEWHQVTVEPWRTFEAAAYARTVDATGPGYAGTQPGTCTRDDCPANCPLNGTGRFAEYARMRDNGTLWTG